MCARVYFHRDQSLQRAELHTTAGENNNLSSTVDIKEQFRVLTVTENGLTVTVTP